MGSWRDRAGFFSGGARASGADGVRAHPGSRAAAGQAFARPRQGLWTLLRETWDSVLVGREPFIERSPAGQPPRFVKMREIEDDYLGRALSDPGERRAARERILKVIGEYRDR
jgi:hypothetical protein